MLASVFLESKLTVETIWKHMRRLFRGWASVTARLHVEGRCPARQARDGHLVATLAELVRVLDVPPQAPLAGLCYAMHLMNSAAVVNEDALSSVICILGAAIRRFDYNFQDLQGIKTYLQQTAGHLMGHLIQASWPCSMKWGKVEGVCQRVLEEFELLILGSDAVRDSALDVMALLDEHLPPIAGMIHRCSGCQTVWVNPEDARCPSCGHVLDLLPAGADEPKQGPGWDTPFVACLADALSTTSHLSSVVSCLVRHAIQNERPERRRRASDMLERAFLLVQDALQAPTSRSRHFIALVLTRDLVANSVELVENKDEEGLDFDNVLTHLLHVLQMAVGRDLPPVTPDLPVQLCTFQGIGLGAAQLPSPLASLYVMAATFRANPIPTGIAVRQLFELAAKRADDQELHRFLTSCQAEALASSNSLGLAVLLPGHRDDFVQRLLIELQNLAQEDSAQAAAARFSALCAQKHNDFRGLVQCMRAVGEIACLQRSAVDEASADHAFAICNRLPQEALGPAAVLFAAAAGDDDVQEIFDWNRDLLDMDPEDAAPWRSSVIAHILCFLGAAHRSINDGSVPLGLEPFRRFLDLDQQSLRTTFWPGLPDSFWQALRYAGLHKHGLPPNANIAWAQCECGYRYCYGNCGAPTSSGPCPSPNSTEGQGACTRHNGGRGHKFCPGQRLLAIVATAPPHGVGWPPIFPDMVRDFPAAVQYPVPRPGLFGLTEADESISVKRATRASVAHSLMTETVRQNWNQPFGKPPPPGSGLRPVTFRVLHLLVHASALIGVGME